MNLKKLNPLYYLKKINNWIDRQHFIIQVFVMLSFVFFVRTYVFGLYIVPTGSMEPTMLVGESFFADKLTIHFSKIKKGHIVSFNDPTFVYSENYLKFLFQKYIFGPESWTKRVIGVPGDHIQGKIEKGRPVVYLNGDLLDEPYINPYPLVCTEEISHHLCLNMISKTPFFEKKSRPALKTFDPLLAMEDPKQPFYNLTRDISLIKKYNHHIVLYPFIPSSEVSDEFDITLKQGEYFGMGDNRLGSFDSRGFGVIKEEFIHGRIVFRIFSFDTASSLVYEILGIGQGPIGIYPLIPFFKKARSWDRWFTVMK